MLKKYLEYVNETFDKDESKEDDIINNVEDESNEDDKPEGEISDEDLAKHHEDDVVFPQKEDMLDEPINNEEPLSIGSTQTSKILIINGCEPDSSLDKKTNDLKENLGSECEEIHLYQLNIQPPKKQESKDGMYMVYKHVEEASAIIFACELIKGRMSDVMETAISRLKAHYTKKELANKIFGAIIIGSEDKIKNTLVLTALNDFGMIVAGDCLSFSDNKSAFNVKKMSSCLTNLCASTQNLRTEEETDIKSFDKFEAPIDNESETESSDEDFMDSMKSDFTPFEEEEECVSDSDEKDNDVNDETSVDSEEDKKEDDITESFKVIPFDEFIK